MRRVTLRQLEIFVAVVEEGTFAAAADRLGVSQPGISAQVRSLEAHVGEALFDRRRGSRAALTPAGQQLFARAPSMLSQADEIGRLPGVRQSSRAKTQLRIIAREYILEHWIRPALSDFIIENPAIVPLVGKFSTTLEMETALRNGRADLAYLTTYRFVTAFECDLLRERPCGLYVAPGHPLAGRSALTAAEIARYPFVLPLADSPAELLVRTLLGDAGIPHVTAGLRAQHLEVVKELAAKGLGIACLISDGLVSTGVVRLDYPLPSMKTLAVHGRRNVRAEASCHVAFMRRILGELTTDPADAPVPGPIRAASGLEPVPA